MGVLVENEEAPLRDSIATPPRLGQNGGGSTMAVVGSGASGMLPLLGCKSKCALLSLTLAPLAFAQDLEPRCPLGLTPFGQPLFGNPCVRLDYERAGGVVGVALATHAVLADFNGDGWLDV